MKYHLTAFITVFIWSLTYISTKIVLEVFTPLEISLYRFTIGYIFLLLIKRPETLKINLKKDLNLILSGFFGIFLYYVVENSATKHTQASHVAIIASTIPLITSIMAHYINRDEKFTIIQIVTFILSFTGVGFIVLEGKSIESGLPIGNLLALIGAFIFGFYNIFLKRISTDIHPIERARKVNFYGLIFIIILFLITGSESSVSSLLSLKYLVNILFLGIVASGTCILLWGYSITGIGAIKTSKYIYLAPLITSFASLFFLSEEFSILKSIGMVLIISGMLIPELYTKLLNN